MTSTSPDGDPAQIPIFLGDTRPARMRFYDYDDVDGIWCCRFSADGKEIIAGGSGKIYGLFFGAFIRGFILTVSTPVCDLQAYRRPIKVNAHRGDVNSCCWADAGSGNILVSASDDTHLKVW